MNDIRVVASTPTQYNEILKIYNEGFCSKFKFISKQKSLQLSFADDFGLIDLSSQEKEFVALYNNHVLGVLSLRFYKQSGEKFSPNLSYPKLFKKYGLASIIKALILDRSINYNPPKGELYIDSISVSSSARGQGVGTVLLNFAEAFAKEKGIKKLSLYVMFENPRAKALYERCGYQVKSTRSFKRLKKTTGFSGSYFMIKNLNYS